MGRVINTNGPGKRRNHAMRTIAEILRRLSQKREVDDSVKDMVAMMLFCLQVIDDTVIESISAWEKRGYWKKADDFQQQWWWASRTRPTIEQILTDESWDQLPELMIKLLPHFSDIQINKLTRSESLWQGAYQTFRQKNTSQTAS